MHVRLDYLKIKLRNLIIIEINTRKRKKKIIYLENIMIKQFKLIFKYKIY